MCRSIRAAAWASAAPAAGGAKKDPPVATGLSSGEAAKLVDSRRALCVVIPTQRGKLSPMKEIVPPGIEARRPDIERWSIVSASSLPRYHVAHLQSDRQQGRRVVPRFGCIGGMDSPVTLLSPANGLLSY